MKKETKNSRTSIVRIIVLVLLTILFPPFIWWFFFNRRLIKAAEKVNEDIRFIWIPLPICYEIAYLKVSKRSFWNLLWSWIPYIGFFGVWHLWLTYHVCKRLNLSGWWILIWPIAPFFWDIDSIGQEKIAWECRVCGKEFGSREKAKEHEKICYEAKDKRGEIKISKTAIIGVLIGILNPVIVRSLMSILNLESLYFFSRFIIYSLLGFIGFWISTRALKEIMNKKKKGIIIAIVGFIFNLIPLIISIIMIILLIRNY